MDPSPRKWLRALKDCLTQRRRLPAHFDEPPHCDATPELERHLEQQIERRLGRPRRGTAT